MLEATNVFDLFPNQLPYDEAKRESFLKIFMSWLAVTMPDVSEKELKHMTTLVRDIRHTRFYKDVTEESRREGKTTGRLKQLREMLDEGAISQEYFDKKVNDLKDQGLI